MNARKRLSKFKQYLNVFRMIADRLHEQEQSFVKEMEQRRTKPDLGQCCNCVYGDFSHCDNDQASEVLGKCRRHPPQVVGISGNLEYTPEIHIGELPRVDTEDWCGEHRSSL